MGRRSTISGFLLLTGACLSAGCTPSEPVAQAFETYDSSGIEVVVSHAPVGFEHPWTLTQQPVLRVGSGEDEEPYFFGSVTGATRLEDGSLVVLDGMLRVARRFNATGQHLLSFGREGEGPGEFQSPKAIRRKGDTLLVLDSDGTVARFDWDGSFLSETRPQGLEALGQTGRPEFRGILPSGTPWGSLTIHGQDKPRSGVYRPRFALFLAGSEWTSPKTIGPFLWMADHVADFSMGYYPVFATAMAATSQPPGLVAGDNETFTVDLFDSEGTHVRRIQYPEALKGPELNALEKMRRWLREWSDLLAQGAPDALAAQYRRWIDELPVPKLWPGFRHLMSDEAGYLWVFEYLPLDGVPHSSPDPADTNRMAMIFHPDGYLLGSIPVPRSLIPLEIGVDYLVARVWNEVDAEEVCVYLLSRG